VFISHASQDRATAARLCGYLESRGLTCWMAPRDVVPGQDYDIQLDQAIQECLAFISLISSDSNASRFVKSEVELAFSCRKPIFPVRIADVQPARGLQLYLRTAHWADAFGSLEQQGFEILANSLRRLSSPGQPRAEITSRPLEPAAAAAPAVPDIQAASSRPRRSLVIASVAASALFLLVAISLIAGNQLEDQPEPGPADPPTEPDTRTAIDTGADATPAPAVAIPASRAAARSESMIGSNLADIDSQIAEAAGIPSGKGVAVTYVIPGYPADQAGAKVGDIIYAINGSAVSGADDAIARLRAAPVGKPLRVDVRRRGASHYLSVVPVERISDEEQARLNPAPRATATAVAAPTGALDPENLEVARWIRLPFYVNAQLWEFGIRDVAATRAYLVPQTGPAVFLNGKSVPIHDFNKVGGLDLSTADKAASYLRFFGATVWGEQGAFRIVESPANLPAGSSEEILKSVYPLSPQPHARGWSSKASVLYGDTIYDTELVVDRTGMVEMIDDVARQSSPDLRSTLYVNEQRQRASLRDASVGKWPLDHLIPGAWSNASEEEVLRVRLLILASRR
jgi:membrane-associated protease RseP (regulator of RpoE activity)